MDITVGKFVELADEAMGRLNLIKKELAQKLGIEKEYFSKLYNGKKPIPSHIFERLKQLTEQPLPQKQIEKPPDTVQRVWGHIDQLTKQIAQLQGEVAVLRDHHERRMEEMEKKIETNTEAIRLIRNRRSA